MNAFDFSPLFRSTVGFDRLPGLLDAASRTDTAAAYPPYNIEKADNDSYRITMAVAGFSEDEIEIEVHENTLKVRGLPQAVETNTEYLYRGIAGRSFERRFQLADHVKVSDAHLENGLLHIDLKREVPEEMKPRNIQIKSGSPKSIFGKARDLLDSEKADSKAA